ncbi:MAG: ATP phosphoribosyltransferase regulatory subunit [Oscillospiraceae bacterium]|nr:ATP phosphoribosyltransferase regulatory subunit [Oscillospiraceae bacterium]
MYKPGQNPEEIISGALRGLFESRGFCRTRPGRFEDYNLYVENRNFLASENVITFMDMDGRLLALKPDVTLSVVKNIPDGGLAAFEKLYYIDEVYRVSRETHDYRVLSQIGMELIGPPHPFSNIEAVDLALHALALIGAQFVLDVSHLGFVSGMLDSMGLPSAAQQQSLAAIHAKSAHELGAVLSDAGIADDHAEKLLALCEMRGVLGEILPKLDRLCLNNSMRDAVDELSQLHAALCRNGHTDKVFLDFSVVGDFDYYNGLLFTGYVQGVPKAVLSGGRYDNLLRRMGKKSRAIGFAVDLSGLNLYHKSGRTYDFDAMISYEDGCSPAGLLDAQSRLLSDGIRVRLEAASSSEAAFSSAKHYLFTKDNILKEVKPC